MESVTTITTDHTISSGTEKSYSTAKTEGTSTSLADTVTWNNWEEVSESLQQRIASSNIEVELKVQVPDGFWKQARQFTFGVAEIAGGIVAPATACTASAIAAGATLGGFVIPGGVICAGTVAGGAAAVADGWGNLTDSFSPDEAQTTTPTNMYQTVDVRLDNQVQDKQPNRSSSYS